MRIGIDLGGTKIEILALDDGGQTLYRKRVDTPQGSYSGTLEAMAQLVLEAEAFLKTTGSVGIGIPGALSLETGRVKNANSVCLIGQALPKDLGHMLQREIRVANDANCFALSEATDGAAAGCPVVFGVILGTGVGGGVVVHGRPLHGCNAIAGEWGHNPLSVEDHPETTAPLCYCGRRGCVETWLSGPGLARDHFLHSGVRLTPPQIVSGAAHGDPNCEASLQRYEERLAKALANVINILDPDAIVLGGGLSSLDRLYVQVPHLWLAHVFSDSVRTRLLPPRFGDASGVRGAAWLWPPSVPDQ